MPDITDIERLNYYEGEFLGAVDFEAEQEYHRDMRRRHNIGPHTWGIVSGLDVAQFLNGGADNEVDVFIQPGVAVDGNGVTPPDVASWTQPTTLPTLPANAGEVVIAFDDSVPFQALPDDNTTANWLVPLGQVLWDGPNERFLQCAAAAANKNRQYAG